jgi:hypothetical protein
MQKFVNDDESYLAWTLAHPAGFVLNVPQKGTAVPLVLHTARCAHVTSTTRTNYTTTDYYKICSMERIELVTWVHAQSHGQLQYRSCGHCQPALSSSPATTHRPRGSMAAHMVIEPDMGNEVGVTDERQPLTAVPALNGWPLWARGNVLLTLDDIVPHLACWEAKTHPEQIALQTYLDEVMDSLALLPPGGAGLFLHLDVGLVRPQKVLKGNDLENYLTPLFGGKRLDQSRFHLVSATKRVGIGSRLVVGWAIPRESDVDDTPWSHFACRSRIGETGADWKQDLHDRLAGTGPDILPDGAVEVEVAWRCEAKTASKWSNWWKPTGDAMGPVLGEPYAHQPFNPADDRIVSLAFHLITDPLLGKAVDVGMWWRPHHTAAI